MMTLNILSYSPEPALLYDPQREPKISPLRLSYEYSASHRYAVLLLPESLEQEEEYLAIFASLERSSRYEEKQALLVDLRQQRFFYRAFDTEDKGKVVSKLFAHNMLGVQLAHYLITEVRLNETSNEYYLTSLAGNLTACLINLLEQPSEMTVSITPYHLRQIHAFVEVNMDRLITLDELADVVKLSSFHFARQFKQTTKETPYQYVTRLKMHHAKNQLLNTRASVIDIGMQVGYENPSHFSRAFKRTMGISPTQLRKTLRSDEMLSSL